LLDGQQIAFTVLHATAPAALQTDAYLSSVDGSHTRNLSSDPKHADTRRMRRLTLMNRA
jgi:hypothetical protein